VALVPLQNLGSSFGSAGSHGVWCVSVAIGYPYAGRALCVCPAGEVCAVGEVYADNDLKNSHFSPA
jgi:hypothetical protein